MKLLHYCCFYVSIATHLLLLPTFVFLLLLLVLLLLLHYTTTTNRCIVIANQCVRKHLFHTSVGYNRNLFHALRRIVYMVLVLVIARPMVTRRVTLSASSRLPRLPRTYHSNHLGPGFFFISNCPFVFDHMTSSSICKRASHLDTPVLE